VFKHATVLELLERLCRYGHRIKAADKGWRWPKTEVKRYVAPPERG
jgi:hypothetical protein